MYEGGGEESEGKDRSFRRTGTMEKLASQAEIVWSKHLGALAGVWAISPENILRI